MKKALKQEYLNRPTVAAIGLTNVLGLAVKDILYGIEDYIIYTDGKNVYQRKIYYNTKNSYFYYGKIRINMNEVMLY